MAAGAMDDRQWGATVLTDARDVDSLYANVWKIMMQDEKQRVAVERYATEIKAHAKSAIYRFSLTKGKVEELVGALRTAGGMHLARLAQERKVVRMRNQRLLRINSLVNNSLRKTLMGMVGMSICYLLVGIAVVAIAFGISSGTEFQVYDTITVDQPTVDVCNCAVDSAHCLDNFLSSAMRNTDDKPQVTIVSCYKYGSTVTSTFLVQGFSSQARASAAIETVTDEKAREQLKGFWNATSVTANQGSTPSRMPGGPDGGTASTWIKRAAAVAVGCATAIPLLTAVRYAIEVQILACLGVGGCCSCLRSWSCCRISRHVGSKVPDPTKRTFPELSYGILRAREVLVDAKATFGAELTVKEDTDETRMPLRHQARTALLKLEKALEALLDFKLPPSQAQPGT